MYSKERLLQDFGNNLTKYSISTSSKYRILGCKPSLETLRKHYGGWKNSLKAVGRYYNDNVIEEGIVEQIVEFKEGGSKEDKERIRILTETVSKLRRHTQTTEISFSGTTHKFGYVSDTHVGSIYADLALLETAYDVFEKQGITKVLHSGDLLDGIKIYRGQEFELEAFGEDAQVELTVNRYPKKPGITTYFIAGNHDRSFYKLTGSDVGLKLQERRPDLQYIGHQEANIIIGDGDHKATIRLVHPDGGSAYALSYKPQKYIESLASGTKPDILLVGHYHKAEVLFFRGVISVQGGTLQQQTPFMRGKSLSAAMGFWTIDVTVGPNRIIDFTPKFYPVRS
ncbi:MAG: metallophosphoesterase family protein [Candidatus Shapirobacteria bacterium]